MDEREGTRSDVTHPRARVNEVAQELARRAKPAYVKDRARDKARTTAIEVKDRTLDSPLAMSILGGLATYAIARLVTSRREAHRFEGEAREQPYYGYGAPPTYGATPTYGAPPPVPGAPEMSGAPGKMEELKTSVGEKVEAARTKVSEKVEAVRERLPTREELRDKASDVGGRARGIYEEQPMIAALGAIALGAALGFLLPVSRKERELIGPYREQASQKAEELLGEVRDRIEGRGDAGQPTPPVPGGPPIPRA